MSRAAAVACTLVLWTLFVWIFSVAVYEFFRVTNNPTESICTMDGDQAREFARQCEAEGGGVRIHEYTCEKPER